MRKEAKRMNKCIFMGRLCNDPDVRYGGANNTCVAKFSLAVDRRFKRDGEPTADFFQITAFGKLGEFAEKYLTKGTKIVMSGSVQNNNYTNKDGQKVYGFAFIADSIEFAESKRVADENRQTTPETQTDDDGFMSIPDDIAEELPFA
jgi:single-strand DNA-binding protein